MEGSSQSLLTVRERQVSRAGMQGVLRDLEMRSSASGMTLYSTPGRYLECLQALPERDAGALAALGRMAPRVEKWGTGAVVFWGEGAALGDASQGVSSLAILPPFPVETDQALAGWDVSPLRSLLARDYMVGVVLLRLGRYAVGVFRGGEMLASKTDTRYVKGRHSAGGTSQKRFERVREKQVQEIFRKTCSVVKERFAPFEDRLDYIFLGGERFTLQGLLKRCDYLQGLSAKTSPRLLNVRDPTHVALEGAIDTVWESRVLSVG